VAHARVLPSLAIFTISGLSHSSSSRRVGPRPLLTMPKLSAPISAACQALWSTCSSVSFVCSPTAVS